jgi:8-oxo-dGTP pyrophosphatase MutT (NUDIX family)
MPKDKWTSAGGVVLDNMEEPYRVFVCKPSNNYGPWCFPKGRVDPGEGIEATALREVQEEAGVPAKLLPNGNLGTGIGSYSITHYFMMVRTGPVGGHDYEMEEVRAVTFEEAEQLFLSEGNSRDIGILNRARDYLAKHAPKSVTIESKQPINELHTNLLGKIFFTTLGAWLVGKAVNTKIRGTVEQVRAVSNAMLASRNFQEELRRPGATVESVMQKLGVKHMTASEFERILGVPWPL